jgi:penicillin amidase
VAVGHNDDVAWGVTNSGADVVDLFLEDEGAAIDVVDERIEVKGGDTVLERVEITPRGPIVSPAVASRGPSRCAQRGWTRTPSAARWPGSAPRHGPSWPPPGRAGRARP